MRCPWSRTLSHTVGIHSTNLRSCPAEPSKTKFRHKLKIVPPQCGQEDVELTCSNLSRRRSLWVNRLYHKSCEAATHSRICENSWQQLLRESPQNRRVLGVESGTVIERMPLALEPVQVLVKSVPDGVTGHHHVERRMICESNKLGCRYRHATGFLDPLNYCDDVCSNLILW